MNTDKTPPILLEVIDLVAGYGPTEVLHKVSLNISSGQIVTLIGANGAGKTTTLRSIFGQTKIWKGSVKFLG